MHDLTNMTVGLDDGTYPQPIKYYKGIEWNLVSEEFHNEFYRLWDAAYWADPMNAELYCMLDVLGWLVNDKQFTKETTFDEAWSKLCTVYK